MTRDQKIAHLILGGWAPAKYHGYYTIVFRGQEACVVSHRDRTKSRHETSSWCDDKNHEHWCEWDDLTNQEITALYRIEAGIGRIVYVP